MRLQISSGQLSLGTRGDDVAQVQQALQVLGRDVSAAERASRIFGPETTAVVKVLQAELNVPASGVIDAATVRVINARLGALDTQARVVRGVVRDADAMPFVAGFVQVYRQTPADEQVAGKSPIDAKDGSYVISYTPPPDNAGPVDIRVAVLSGDTVVETEPSSASILTDAGLLEVVDFQVAAAAQPPRSDFERIEADLKPLLGSRNIADLTEGDGRYDVSMLAAQSGYPSEQIAALVQAHRMERDAKIPAPVFYALLDQGLPANGDALLRSDARTRSDALTAAVARGVVPKQIGDKKIEDYLPDVETTNAAPLQPLLGRILNANDLNAFVGRYVKQSQDPAVFWKQLEADPTWASRAADLKFTVQLGALTNNNTPLVAALRARQDIRQASDLVRLGMDDWKSLIATQGASVPPETPGADATEKADNYAHTLVGQVEAAFPTSFFAERLGASPIATFLKANQTYDLRTTYPPQFFKSLPAGQSLNEGDQRQLQSLQRLYRLTGNAREAIALKDLGSAQQIARMSPTAFADQYKDTLPPARAAEIHAKASRRAALALALVGENGSAFNRTSLRALPTIDTQKQMELAQDSIPDWETLFGSFDFCTCQDCASAHGAAAYLVDALRFLGDRGARPALFARRPDLGEIELTCENTNTTLPLIDIVNEVLENAVTPPAAFAPFALSAALEPDLSGPLTTAALSAAFTPPLHPSARIETLDNGKRWRIQDDAFAYGIVKDASGLKVATRSRQTTGSSNVRRATPQYRNAEAYAELGRAVYPWGLPFDLPSAESWVFLAHLGVSRHDLIDALIPPPATFDANDPHIILLAAERLGLTEVERKIVVGEALIPPRQPEDFWGGTAFAVSQSVQDLLDRSGLSYADLVAALATSFVNPGGVASIVPKPGAPLDTCDTTKLQVPGLTADILDRLHRFVRLWRKLDWTIPELGRVLSTLAGANAPALNNETLVKIDHLRAVIAALSLPSAVALALWRPIVTAEPGSLYQSLFYNPSVFKPQDDAFRLRTDGQELAATDKLLADHTAALQAAFRLDPASLALLIARTNGKLTLGNLSTLYHYTVLARQLGLTIANLLVAVDLTAIDPFALDHSQDTLRFIEVVKAIQASGFDIPQLDYLLRRRFNPAAPFVPTDAALAQTLEGMRSALSAIDAASPADRQAQARSIVIDRTAAALSLLGDLCGQLLARVMHGGESAEQRLLALTEIAAPVLARDNAAAQFETLEKLLEIASVIQTTKLPASQIDWLFDENPWLAVAPDPSSTPVPFASWFSLIELQQVTRDLSLDAAATESILGAVTAIRAATDDASRLAGKQAFAEALSRWLGWAPENVATLIGTAADLNDRGLLQAQLPQDYRIGLLSRLVRAISAVNRLGVPAAVARQWCETSVSDAVAAAVRGAAKAKYDDATWQTLAAPLQDALREQQRVALVAYLVARPQIWGAAAGLTDSNDLFAHFLIDVEMSACQLTSRIQQAIASTQLFAQRCLLGLEAGVELNDPKWDQWSWMKTFRVWEASRKIWLYPENWIEPELRDDKTPFFKELENELMQAELDDDAAEQAFTHYLEKLDQVARLEIAGIYEDEDKMLHVFGRTFHTPRTYFYRRRDGDTKVWTPWERVELDIEGDHVIPVLWNGKLMLIWPIFAEKQQEQQVIMPSPGSKVSAGARYLEIQLAWSEYQHGRWSGKLVSDPVTFMAYQGDDKVLFGDRVGAPVNAMARIRNDGGAGDDIPPNGGGGGGGGHPGGPLPPPPTSPSGDPKPAVRPELFSFKALVAGDTLSVRGYLRRDYRSAPTSGDAQIAYPFGEFRFSGCRKIITAVPNAQVARRNFALAPSGTKFDRMWFTETASPLILFDGTFPTFPNEIMPTVFSNENEPASIAGNPAPTLANKLDIRVLDRTPWTYRLLPPHQDLQFVGDRPFFFMDDRRTFIGRSTGASGKRPPFSDWVNANLATVWRADYFPAPSTPPQTNGPNLTSAGDGAPPRPLTMLARTRDGRRVVREMVPIDLKPSAPQKTLLPVFWTTRQYQFANFHHPYVCEFVKALRRQGLPGLLSLDSQEAADPASFDVYQPEPRVLKAYPIDEVEFAAGGAYEIYNWELFFHIPLLIASRLSSNQRFEDAQRWFHFVFDPTGASGGSVPQRYWHTKPFFDRLSSDYEAESVKAIEEIIAQGPPDALKAAVEVWRNDPFNPHAIARLRTTAYQKTVVMKYVDNLVAWADQLFRADTLETINEAAQLYVLAAEILGRRPEIIERNLNRVPETFNSLVPRIGALGNALQDIELLIGDSDDEPPASPPSPSPDLPDMAPYFPVPVNHKLLGYWDTIGARLFNIRHCMNIEGQVRQLPLFEPPIDPALLVRARAAGLSIGEVLSDISTSLPNQRFETIVQKANEMVAEVRNLGAALMAALEKRDTETLSTLRSGQELRMLQAARDVRVAQVDEAEANITALERSRDIAQTRKTFYESRETLNALELTSLVLLGASAVPIEISAHLRVLAGLVQRLGNVKVGSPTTAGIEVGGYFIGVGVEEAAIALDAAASILNISSQVIGRTADHGRRKDDWDLQAELATIELKQIDQQLAAAQIRRAMAEAELRNHDRQIDDARDTDDFLRSKFTSRDLYDWSIGKVSGLYFQSYQLAYDLAKRAEMCMQHELGMTYGETSIIRFGYWDSLKKGLMAGDHLAHDLKRLEVAYLDGNIREYELTKHVSLLGLSAGQLIALKETGACEFEIPEWLLDLDTPGHFMRRLKAVSVTIPCVTGPYTTIHCKATLLKSAYRRTADVAGGYNRRPADDPNGPDERFVDDRKILESIVTSSGQSDSGLFETQGRDERYLPFEGAGAISRWRLELPMQFKTFDYNTISDVILHLRYTARDGGEALRTAAAAAVSATLSNATSGVLVRMFSLRHEFPSEWARFASASTTGTSSITVDLSAKRFPYFTQGRTIAVSNAEPIVRSTAAPGQTGIAPGNAADPMAGAWSGQGTPGAWTVATTIDPKRVDDILLLLAYSLRSQ